MSNTEIEITRTDDGTVLMDFRSVLDNFLMGLAHLYASRREEMHDLLADLVALDVLEQRGMHAQENSVEAIQNNLYGMTGANPYVPLTRDDINRLRRAMDDPNRPRPQPAFQNNGQGMQAISKVEPIKPDNEDTGEIPIYDQTAKAAKNGG